MMNDIELEDIIEIVHNKDILDDKDIAEAQKLFKKFKQDLIIRNESFSDDVWLLSDQLKHIRVNFWISDFSFQKYAKLISCSKERFTILLKTFVIFCFDTLQFVSIQRFVRDLKNLLRISPISLLDNIEKIIVEKPFKIKEFFLVIPCVHNQEEWTTLCKFLKKKSKSNYKQQRELSEYDSCFLFSDIIDDYWKYEVSEMNRLFFFPVYLWWKFSSIIPIRPTEFCLTPRNCLVKKSDGWYMKIRRTKLKGNNKTKTHFIDNDYKLSEIPISDDLAKEINEYLKKTKNCPQDELGTLFLLDTYYKKIGMSPNKRSRYFSYNYLNRTLIYFFDEVIVGKYHLDIEETPSNDYLKPGCINMICLGDTRHLAIQNCYFNFNDVEIAIAVAGHESVDINMHYATNITKMVKCSAYRELRRVEEFKIVLKNPGEYAIQNLLSKQEGVAVKDGKCFSKKVANGIFDDCKESGNFKIDSNENEIYLLGNCFACKYFYPSNYSSANDKCEEAEKNLGIALHHLSVVLRSIDSRRENAVGDLKQAFLDCNNKMYEFKKLYKERLVK